MRRGHKYRTVEYDGECLRIAVAEATGWSRRKMRWIDPDDYNEGIDWWDEWDVFLAERGYKFIPVNPVNPPKGYWIAITKSLRPEYREEYRHAVVYKGDKLHDSNSDCDYSDEPILYGLEVVPL